MAKLCPKCRMAYLGSFVEVYCGQGAVVCYVHRIVYNSATDRITVEVCAADSKRVLKELRVPTFFAEEP